MSESAKEVFARIPEARRDAAVREADTSTVNVYRDTFINACGTREERVAAAAQAEETARAKVFSRYAASVVESTSNDRFAFIKAQHDAAERGEASAVTGAHNDRAWLIGEVKRLRTELATTNAELQRWKRERCMSPADGPWSADGARIIGRGNRIVAHTSSQSLPNPDAVQDAHTIAAMLNHAEAQAPLDAFDASWERVRITAERAYQALSQFGETQAPEAIELRAALDSLVGNRATDVVVPAAKRVRPTVSRGGDGVYTVTFPAVAKPSDAWPRVVFVVGEGYDCHFATSGKPWSDKQRDACRYSKQEATERRDAFRGYGNDARVIRLRPRAK